MLRALFLLWLVLEPALAMAGGEPEGRGQGPGSVIPIVVYEQTAALAPGFTLTVNGGGLVRLDEPPAAALYCTLSASELAALRARIGADGAFFGLDSAAIAKEVRAEQQRSGQVFAPGLAATTRIALRGVRGMHTVRYYALRDMAAAYPSIGALQQLGASAAVLDGLRDRLRAIAGRAGVLAAPERSPDRSEDRSPDQSPGVAAAGADSAPSCG